MPYKLTRKAASDLHRIFVEGVRLFGSDQATRCHARFKHAFDLLSADPYLARERVKISPPVRIHSCGSHVIVYLADESAGMLIPRVRHGREDWATDP